MTGADAGEALSFRNSATTADTPAADAAGARPPKLAGAGVRKWYRSRRHGLVHAIDGLDLHVDAGEFVSLLGPSGCGKSTFLHIAGGFVPADAGTVTLDGVPVTGPGPDRGVVFQQHALFPWKTVMGNITFGLARQGMGRRQRAETARRYLDMVNLHGVDHLYPRELSGGMQQRLALARTLATDPDVLLMDEPFGALDAQTRAVMQTELNAIWQQTHKTVLFVTHAVEEAIFLSDRVYVLSARPATVLEEITIPIPRPRDAEEILTHPAYAQIHRRIWELLRAQARPDRDTGS
jgi:NitT/TauT family transport system ATP-binding protein